MKLRVSALIILITLSIVISGCGGGGGGGTIPSIPPDNTPTNPPQVTATPTPIVYGNVSGTVLLSGGIPLNSGYVVIKSYVANEKIEKNATTEIEASGSYTRNTLTDPNGNFGFSNFPQGSARIEAWQNQSSFLSDPNSPIAAMNTTVVLNTTGIILQQGTVEPTPMPTAVPTPTNTPLPGSTPTNTPLPGSTPTFTPTPTSTNTPTATPITSKSISINVKDLFDSSNKSGMQVFFNDVSVGTTDASGSATFDINANGRLKVTGNNIERSQPIYTSTLNYNVSVLPNGYNTTFLRGMTSASMRRYLTCPKIIVYDELLDPSAHVSVPTAKIDELKSVLQTELNTMAKGFFNGIVIEIYHGRPNDDPRFTILDPDFGYIDQDGIVSICFKQDITGGTGISTCTTRNGVIVGGGVVLESGCTKSTMRHEFGHVLFQWPHPFDVVTAEFNEFSVMNYASTGKRSDTYSTKDIEVSNFTYCRPIGNTNPDYDPDGTTAKQNDVVEKIRFID